MTIDEDIAIVKATLSENPTESCFESKPPRRSCGARTTSYAKSSRPRAGGWPCHRPDNEPTSSGSLGDAPPSRTWSPAVRRCASPPAT